ncbi:MAG: 3-ketoacyl-ACP reductase, partial [Bacteroidetes bacterium]
MQRIALITGGSRGIGLGIAEALAAEGWQLAINGMRSEIQVGAVLERLRTRGVKVIYYQGNVGRAEDRQKILDRVRTRFGALHLLVNNAGVAPPQRLDILETTEANYDHVMDINLKGSFFLAQATARWMLEQAESRSDFRGAIVNISSVSATVASINRVEYCISKAGMAMMTQALALRLAPHGIPVYEVRPGIIETDMTAAVKEKYDALLAEGLAPQ